MSSHHNIKQLKPSKNSRYNQGYINTNNCKKIYPQFKNDKIIYRSSYEKKFMIWLETCKDVKFWGSECICIPYLYVVDGQTHHYYPDYVVEFTNGDTMVVEIKPYNQTQQPINENSYAYTQYIKNRCKWKAAMEFCQAKGFKFRILTEHTINSL